MKKQDMTIVALFFEAFDIIFGLAYIGLQIFYGIYYQVPVYKFVINILVLILVYIGLSILANYPERLNHLPAELCTGNIRKYSLRVIRIVKFVFVTGLLIPCIFDAVGYSINSAYSLVGICIIIVAAAYYEYRIISELKNLRK